MKKAFIFSLMALYLLATLNGNIVVFCHGSDGHGSLELLHDQQHHAEHPVDHHHGHHHSHDCQDSDEPCCVDTPLEIEDQWLNKNEITLSDFKMLTQLEFRPFFKLEFPGRFSEGLSPPPKLDPQRSALQTIVLIV